MLVEAIDQLDDGLAAAKHATASRAARPYGIPGFTHTGGSAREADPEKDALTAAEPAARMELLWGRGGGHETGLRTAGVQRVRGRVARYITLQILYIDIIFNCVETKKCLNHLSNTKVWTNVF